MRDLATDGAMMSALVGGSIWIKWAAAPVLIAFELGRLFERARIRGRQAAARGRARI